jgi:hypothetical protein
MAQTKLAGAYRVEVQAATPIIIDQVVIASGARVKVPWGDG